MPAKSTAEDDGHHHQGGRGVSSNSGGLNAGTPVAIASVPVNATAPDENARSNRPGCPTAWVVSETAARTPAGARGLAEDDDPEGPDGDHGEGTEDEQVGRDGEDVAGLAQAAQVGQGDEPERADPDPSRESEPGPGAETICSTADDVDTAAVRL